MNGEPRFIADASLAGLSKWLRILGYDTAVYFQEAGRSMMRQAQESGRILLTRRTDMMERQFSGRMILVPETEILKQLAFVVCKLSLEIHPHYLFTICLSCNEKLSPVKPEEVRDAVPEYVYEHCPSYNRCPKCGKVYWPGTHVQHILKNLKDNGIIRMV
jgi:uncharacterized protein